MRTYHYSVRIGRGKTTIPTVVLGSLRGSLAFFWKGHGVQSPWLAISQTYLSALFSCQRPDGHNQSQYELEAFNIKV